MDRMSLREAAERTYRSVTTLRRYIRSGRLLAHKDNGRYGPEYFVRPADLERAGLVVDALPEPSPTDERPTAIARRSGPTSAPAPAVTVEVVPVPLYQELQYKHEQLLVQYGMMRAGGLRAVELRDRLESRERELAAVREERDALRERLREDAERHEAELRSLRFELEGRALEIEALRDKVRTLELLTRNRMTSESIDDQFGNVVRQLRRVEQRAAEERDRRQAPATVRRPWLVRDVPPGADH